MRHPFDGILTDQPAEPLNDLDLEALVGGRRTFTELPTTMATNEEGGTDPTTMATNEEGARRRLF